MNFFLILSLALFIIFPLEVQSNDVTLVIKKNRRFASPPYCFAYARVFNNATGKSISCYGYEYDCIDVQNNVQIGETVDFSLEECETTSEFIEFAGKNFQTRLDSIAKSTTNSQ